MDFIGLIISFIVNIIIVVGIPIGVFIYFAIKKKNLVKPFLVGVLVFVISQMFLRIPLINVVLTKMSWFNTMINVYPVLYAVFLGLSAGVFEEIGRMVGFESGLKENRSWLDGIAFGLGHGGIEAVLFAGISNIQNLIILISLNNGTFNEAMAGVSKESVISMFSSTSSMMVLYAGIERVAAVMLHIGFTMLVLYGINKRKKSLYITLAVLIHGTVDAVVVICQQVGVSIDIIEVICMAAAIIMMVITIRIKKYFNDFERKGQNEKVY